MHRSTPGAFEKNGVYYKEVQDIRAKDKVLALNEKTGEERYSVVKQTFILEADEIYELTYEDGTLVETTWNHPFYVHGKGWTKAENLVAGDVSRTERNGSLKMTRVRVLERAETVYNFEVEEDHNYYVSEAGVLVHNEAGCEGFGIAIAISEKCGSNRRCIDENYKAYQKGKLLGAQHAPIAAPFVGLAAMAGVYAPELAISAYIRAGSGVSLGYLITDLVAGDATAGLSLTAPGRRMWRRAIKKIPRSWSLLPNKKTGSGLRFSDPVASGNKNGVRFDIGDPKSAFESQRVDHVIVRYNGKVIGRDGKPLSRAIKEDPLRAHIPLAEYVKWKTWYSP